MTEEAKAAETTQPETSLISETSQTDEAKAAADKATADKTAADKTAADKAVADKAAADKAAADKAAASVPLTVKDITLPEGFTADEPLMKEFVDTLNKGLPAKELAAELIKLQTKAVTTASDRSSQEFADLQKQWREQVLADPEIGGNKWEKTRQNIGRLLDKYGSHEAKLVFDTSGAGNNVHVAKMLAKIAQDLVAEGGPISGSPGGGGERDHANILYPNQGKQ